MGSSDRREYLTAEVLDQGLLDRCQDNLENGLEMVAIITAPDSLPIRVSDRNKYVGNRFYSAITKFPLIRRTIGDWLAPTIEFSRLEITLGNVDGRFNKYLPGGADFNGWIGREVEAKIGIRDLEATFTTIYKGRVTEIGGVSRARDSVTFISRDSFDRVNKQFPTAVFNLNVFPYLEDNIAGVYAPIIYGDWTVSVGEGKAIVPAFPVNGALESVLSGDVALELVISENDNAFFDTESVYLKRGDDYFLFSVDDITILGGNRIFSIKQENCGGATTIDENPPETPVPFVYKSGDSFFVKVKGKDLGAYSDNPVWQARDILISIGGAAEGDFDANWATYRDKSSPVESAISAIKSRIWAGEQQNAMEYALSLLEQVRLEVFESRELKFKINSLHFDDFPAVGDIPYELKNWDIVADSFTPQLDDKNTWNRARGEYGFDPSVNQQGFQTPIFRNQAAISQCGKEISKSVVFPDLYDQAVVIAQLTEMLKLASAYNEFIEVTLTPRAILKDIGDFVKMNVTIGATVFTDVPAMIREIGYDPSGMKIPVKLWSFQMVPYHAYTPSYAGLVGGYNATIVQEE
jgi:hypothetical protein